MSDKDGLVRSPQTEVQKGIEDLSKMAAALSPERDDSATARGGALQMQPLGERSALKRIPSMNERNVEEMPTLVPTESSYVLLSQVIFPFTIAGVGMVLAGMLLDVVQNWKLFKEVPEIFILVPSLLGLKGNLEMTLASRLSTLANLGHLNDYSQRYRVITANMALIQVQATVVGFLASSFAIALAWIPQGKVDWAHAALLCASSLATACSASFLLSLLMSAVVIASCRLRINPDNVATPIAASLGDLTTLAVLSLFGSMFLRAHLSESWLNSVVIIFFLCLVPVWARVALKDEGTSKVLSDGWSPVIFSMLISSGGGFILERAVREYPKIASFQPVINGVGGNLVAVQASRISTSFHQMATLGELPNGWTVRRFLSIRRAFFSKEWDSRSARVLLSLVLPGHILFNWLISLLHFSPVTPPGGSLFTSLYLLAALLQVLVLLLVCQWLVALMWTREIDPDNAAIPYLTAIGDVIGTAFLFITFHLVDRVDPRVVEVAYEQANLSKQRD